MGLDIKIPIGMLFSVLGLLLAIFGLATNGNAMYERSLDININLWTGLFMLVFGAFMLILAWIDRNKGKAEAD